MNAIEIGRRAPRARHGAIVCPWVRGFGLLAVLVVALLSVQGWAAEFGSVTGTVQGAKGNPVAGAYEAHECGRGIRLEVRDELPDADGPAYLGLNCSFRAENRSLIGQTGHRSVPIALRLADVHRLHYYADVRGQRVTGMQSLRWRRIDC